MIRRIIPALAAALFALLFVFAPATEARAEGFELGVGFGWFGEVGDHAGGRWQGFHFILSPGWRFNEWIGVYIDQGFGGHFRHHDQDHFVGQTVFNVRGFLKAGPGDLWGEIGIGAHYLSWDDHTDSAFAFKLGIGYTYDITDVVGIGANFDYMLGAFSDTKYHGAGTAHYLDLMLHLRFKF